MLGIDHQHGKSRNTEPGTDPGISRSQWRGTLPSAQPRGVTRVDKPDLAAAELWPPQTPRQGTGEALREQEDRVKPGPDGAPDSVPATRRPSASASVSAASLFESLQQSRHRTAGASRRGSRNLSGPATQKILQREWHEFHEVQYERLARLSVAQLYRLRKTRTYRHKRVAYQPTRPTQVAIGQRRRPAPQGRPGYLRVDTVHQGDLDGVKGL